MLLGVIIRFQRVFSKKRQVTGNSCSRPVSAKGVVCRLHTRTRGLGGMRAKITTTMRRGVGDRQFHARLVAGISRSVGAPLASVVGCISLVGGRPARDRAVQRCVRILSQRSGQLGGLVRSLVRTSGTSAKGLPIGPRMYSTAIILARVIKRFSRGTRTGRLRVIMRYPRPPIRVCISNERL